MVEGTGAERTAVFDAGERAAWAGRSTAYAASFGRLCAHTVPELLAACGPLPGRRLLDVGTGTGAVAARARAHGAQVSAVDADPGMARVAARAVPEARTAVAALPRLPFARDVFDAVAANFVLNHVGAPRAALAELVRVARPGGRIAFTLWPVPAAPGQALLGRAVEAAGVRRPAHLPVLDPAEDFPRTEPGVLELLTEAGLDAAECRTLAWEHRTGPAEWWSGPAAGVATIGRVVTSRPAAEQAEIHRHFLRLGAPFTAPDGALLLPHTALLASATVPPRPGDRARTGPGAVRAAGPLPGGTSR